MLHLNITFPEDLKEALDQEVKREHTQRSTLIQKAVWVYLETKKQKDLRSNQVLKSKMPSSPLCRQAEALKLHLGF